jgi:hypothetical protein
LAKSRRTASAFFASERGSAAIMANAEAKLLCSATGIAAFGSFAAHFAAPGLGLWAFPEEMAGVF